MKKILSFLGGFLLMFGFVTSVSAATPSNLVGWWKLDEVSGTKAFDSSSSPDDGTLVGGANFSDDFNFNGNDYVNIPDMANKLNITDKITLMATINITDLPEIYGAVISKGDTEPSSYMMHLDKRSDKTYRVCPVFNVDGSYGNWQEGCADNLKFGETYRIAVSFDGKTEFTYIDGLLQNQEKRFSTPMSLTTMSGNLEIGRDTRYHSRYIQGVVKDVQIWNVAISKPECLTTNFIRDSHNLTAAQIGGDVTGILNATGCDIGVYYNNASIGNVSNAEIYNAKYFGVVVDGGFGDVEVNVIDSIIHNIGDVPFSGNQHGNAIYYYGYQTPGKVTGTISGNHVYKYQKGGIIANGSKTIVNVLNNIVTGLGEVNIIAQNGIQIGFAGHGTVLENTVSGNYYRGNYWVSCGLLFYQSGQGLKFSAGTNTVADNQVSICNAGAGPNQKAIENLTP